MMHLMNNDCVNLETFEAFMISLEDTYRDADHMNPTKWALANLFQGN
jgi:hypothetical protein